jgi:hypothetical protein
MLSGVTESPPQRSFNTRSEREVGKPDHRPEVAQAFRDKLQALDDDHRQAAPGARRRDKMPAEGMAAPLSPFQNSPISWIDGKKDGAVGSIAGNACPTQPQEQRAETHIANLGGGSVGDPTSAALTAKFAERLALPSQTVAESQVLLDSSRYLVSSVTISGGADEGMSLSYNGNSANGEGGPHDEETLRQRLEARGLKVAEIHGRS